MKLQEEKVALESTLEYDRIKTDFFSNISHELRTPLNILLSSLQLLNIYIDKIDTDKIAPIKNYLGIMKQNCYRLLRLINNLLDITKIDSGYYILNLKSQNIVTVVEDITLSIVDYLKTKDLEIIFDTDIEEKIISCDEDKIERIMLNLLSNAIKFTEPGGKIEVNIYDTEYYTIISVKDTGMGIKECKLETIFDRFSQVDKSLASNREGSGLGLSIVKNFVDMHGGKIEVRSDLGLGSEFIIYLPSNTIAFTEQKTLNNLDIGMESDPYETKANENIERMSLEFSDIYN
jgi:two-component system phosphate regulon sensor histidine kinase PhoR